MSEKHLSSSIFRKFTFLKYLSVHNCSSSSLNYENILCHIYPRISTAQYKKHYQVRQQLSYVLPIEYQEPIFYYCFNKYFAYYFYIITTSIFTISYYTCYFTI